MQKMETQSKEGVRKVVGVEVLGEEKKAEVVVVEVGNPWKAYENHELLVAQRIQKQKV